MKINVVNKYTHIPTEHDYYIGRGSLLGNPFTHLPSAIRGTVMVANREEACNRFDEYLDEQLKNHESSCSHMLDILEQELQANGEINLVCFCAPHKCHGDSIKHKLMERIKDKQ